MRSKIIIFLLIILSACNQEIEKPKNLISEDKMVEILTELYIYKNLQSINKFEYNDFHKVNFAILDKHNVNYKDFKNSYEYYLIEDEKFKTILERIEANMKTKFELSDSIQLQEYKLQENVEIH